MGTFRARGRGECVTRRRGLFGFVYTALFTAESLSNQTRAGPARAAGSPQECVCSVEECGVLIKRIETAKNLVGSVRSEGIQLHHKGM